MIRKREPSTNVGNNHTNMNEDLDVSNSGVIVCSRVFLCFLFFICAINCNLGANCNHVIEHVELGCNKTCAMHKISFILFYF